MGYESRVYVITPYSSYLEDGKKYAEIIARFNLCVCCNSFVEVFNETCPYLIRNEDGDTEEQPYVEEDKYGKPLKMATAKAVLDAIAKDPESMEYRRTRDFYEFLKSSINHYDELFVVHYGY